MVTKSINTTRLDLYRKYVDNAEGEYPFDHRYELFSLAAVLGYLDGTAYEPTSEDSGYSQEFVKVDDIQNEKHRAAINFIYNLTAMELVERGDADISEGIEGVERDAWTRTKEYADQGLDLLDDELSVQGEIDLLRLINEAEEEWPERTAQVTALFNSQ
jgi:hypothetical protein